MNTSTRHVVSAEEEQLAIVSLDWLGASSASNAARSAASAAPTSSAALARCAAERVRSALPSQATNSNGTKRFLLLTLWIFFSYLIFFNVRYERSRTREEKGGRKDCEL